MKNPIKAYDYLMQAILRGVTYFEEILALFAANYEVLAPHYVRIKNLQI